MGIVNSLEEPHVNIKFCVYLCKLLMGMIKLREAYRSERMVESIIHEWHSTFSKNLKEALLCEKKGGQSRTSITEMNINTGCVI